ncbi:hypothetical protein HLPCO_000150 [Haloplasma contractile SSD-17B]|uniref:Uncharacterized protein n=2 Tax=Haloplasma TaxID=471824 RepID=U2FR95_9MOLU|nr:hypothetical protein HLPCO_000150 [Haloplasma contractile SSD-17B]
MNEWIYLAFLFLVVLSNIYAFKIGQNRNRKEIDSLRKHLNETMKLVFKKQREINCLKEDYKNQEVLEIKQNS